MTQSDFTRIAKGLAAVRNTMAETVFELVVDQMALACHDSDETKGRWFNYDEFVDLWPCFNSKGD